MSKYRRKTKWKTQPDGFTLVEILVVISIISILMSILLPTLSNAREQGRRVDCMSNLKQFTLAWNLYAMDNDDKLCSPNTGWNDGSCGQSNNWVADGPALPGNDIGGHEKAIIDGVMWPYVGDAFELFGCKSTRGNTSIYNRSRLRDYSISNTMGGGCGAVFKSLADVTRPAEKMLFIDADGGLRGSRGSDYQFFWLIGPFRPLEIKNGEPEWSFPRNPDGWPLNIITARHNNGCNLSFADGHCEFWKWKDPRTIELANGQISESAASDDNPDLQRMVQLLKVR
jgi:prepilin-type N-terminal cleavage/methylation domain-containing protein/prepilin-type processing-associated H-X9-DG protein